MKKEDSITGNRDRSAMSEDETAAYDMSDAETIDKWLTEQFRDDRTISAVENGDATALLLRYLCGDLIGIESAQVEVLITGHSETRQKLRRLRDRLDTFEKESWREIAALAETSADRETADAALLYLELVKNRLRLFGRTAEWWHHVSNRAWQTIHNEIEIGKDEGRAAVTLLGNLGNRISASLALPRIALARGGSENSRVTVVGMPPTVQVDDFDAYIGEDGTLGVYLTLHSDSVEDTLKKLVPPELPASLLLQNGGTSVLMGNGKQTRDSEAVQYEWRIEGVGDALGIPPETPLLAEMVTIVLGDSPPVIEKENGQMLNAEWFNRGGKIERLIPIGLPEMPAWKNGRFFIQMILSDADRRACTGHRLELSLPISPETVLRLGEWNMTENTVGNPPILLEADCPDSPDAILPLAALLRARFLPGHAPLVPPN